MIKPKNQKQESSEKYPNTKEKETKLQYLIGEYTPPKRRKVIDAKIKIRRCPKNVYL